MPPPWLATTTLPLDTIAPGSALFRVHRSALAPIFFGPGSGRDPTYRFDSATGTFGVLYVGLGLAGAVVETLLRNPSRRIVDYDALAARSSSELSSTRELRVVRLHGAALQTVGCDNSISTGPYDPCGAWSDALWTHPDAPDGIAYQSRHDPGQICLALFERPGHQLRAGSSVSLIDQLPTVSAILNGYGKSISGGPPP